MDATPEKVPCPSILEGYLSEQEYAAQRGVSLRTCQRDRQLRQAPPHVVLGRQVYYRIAAISDWLRTQERTETRTPTASRAGRTTGIAGTGLASLAAGKDRPQPRRGRSSGAA